MAKKSQSFEQSITRLDEIVRQLEQGNVPLEDALKLFQEGAAEGGTDNWGEVVTR